MTNPAFTGFLRSHWRCVECSSTAIPIVESGIRCAACGAAFMLAGGAPVLLRRDNSLFSPSSFHDGHAPPSKNALRSLLPSPSVNLAREKAFRELRERLETQAAVILIVGGGRQRSEVQQSVNSSGRHLVIAFDIGRDSDVDAFADAHDLPLADGSVDCVITTAVLEHVAEPGTAVAEIRRVLKPAGLLYSEIPFMQQVHEGAYDFTRFTLGGHRLLLRDFEEIRSGAVAGPFTALVWSIEHAAASLAPRWARTPVRAAARLGFFWLKYFDYVTGHSSEAVDASSCTFVLARRSGEPSTPADVVARYGK